ncbi:MAG: hypothetical protein AAF970_11140 [Bacteroidota bacterium]
MSTQGNTQAPEHDVSTFDMEALIAYDSRTHPDAEAITSRIRQIEVLQQEAEAEHQRLNDAAQAAENQYQTVLKQQALGETTAANVKAALKARTDAAKARNEHEHQLGSQARARANAIAELKQRRTDVCANIEAQMHARATDLVETMASDAASDMLTMLEKYQQARQFAGRFRHRKRHGTDSRGAETMIARGWFSLIERSMEPNVRNDSVLVRLKSQLIEQGAGA